MTESTATDKPWEGLEALIADGDRAGLAAFLQALSATEIAYAVSHLDAGERGDLLALLAAADAAGIISEVPSSQAVDLLGDMAPADAAAIVDELRSDQQVDLLTELHADDSAAILEAMEDTAADDLRQRLDYAPDTAGGLMLTETLAFDEGLTVADVVDDLRRHGGQYADYTVLYTYVVDDSGRLVGVLPMRSLLLASRDRRLDQLMIRQPLRVAATAAFEELVEFFEEHGFLGVPVVDAADRLVGVVHRREVQEQQEHQGERTFMEASGIVGGEELRSMPVWTRSGRRLSWLSVNILLNIAAASVIAVYQDTLSAVIALAVFLPIISDMSGCSGNQAVAVSIRELTLGLIRPGELLRVLFGELRVGLLNGVALGVLLGAVAYLWQGQLWLSLVVAAALALNTLVAVAIGGLVPLVLRGFGKDPALASGPILTTVTDMCGFFLVLSLASLALARLG